MLSLLSLCPRYSVHCAMCSVFCVLCSLYVLSALCYLSALFSLFSLSRFQSVSLCTCFTLSSSFFVASSFFLLFYTLLHPRPLILLVLSFSSFSFIVPPAAFHLHYPLSSSLLLSRLLWISWNQTFYFSLLNLNGLGWVWQHCFTICISKMPPWDHAQTSCCGSWREPKKFSRRVSPNESTDMPTVTKITLSLRCHCVYVDAS